MNARRETDALDVLPNMAIHPSNLRYRFSRSGGPGGQNVNKVDTRVTVYFDMEACSTLTDGQRRRIRERLGSRLTRDGFLYVVSSKYRTQSANRRAATERLRELLADALRPQKHRKPTSIPPAAERRRLDEKRRRGAQKRLRRDAHGEE